jgi:LacI family transcriptional regulator
MPSAPPNRSAPTLEDVADAAGVSLATASRVLNGSARVVGEPHRRRVEEAAARLGYTANLSAQATARGTSAVVALLVADIVDPYFGLIAAGVARGADEAGLIVTIAVTDRDPDRELRLVRALRGQRPRAVIFAASSGPAAARSGELANELDAIEAIGGRIVSLADTGAGRASVVVDNRDGARRLAASLSARGYRRAIILAAEEGLRASDERVLGFSEGFTAGGGHVTSVRHGAFSRDAGAAAMRAALDGRPSRGTVVFGVSDVVAIGAMSALRDAGWEPGRDIGVAGFDDIPTADDVTPALTTVRVPLEDVGYRALRVALGDLNAGAVPLALAVVVRASTPALV